MRSDRTWRGIRDRSRVPGEAGLGRRVRPRGGRAARPASSRDLQFTPLDDTRRKVDRPAEGRGARARGCGPPTSGPSSAARATASSSSRCSTRSSAARSGRRSSSAARRPTPATPRSSPTTAPPEQKERYLQPLLDGEMFSCYSMTEPHAGADPTLFKTRAVQGRRRVGHQRLEVLLVERQDRVVPHRHGGDRPRRERVPGHVDVPGADRHARA